MKCVLCDEELYENTFKHQDLDTKKYICGDCVRRLIAITKSAYKLENKKRLIKGEAMITTWE